MKNTIKSLINSFFKKLNIKTNSIEITNIENENIFNIKINTDESGIIIGPQGRNLDSIQDILKLICSKKTGERIKIHLEINDYIKTKDDRLFNFIKHKISYLEKTGKDIKLPFYSSYERKKIHSFVHEIKPKGIFTKSIGEGKERRLYICKEEAKLTIDIDGDDI